MKDLHSSAALVHTAELHKFYRSKVLHVDLLVQLQQHLQEYQILDGVR